MAIGPRTGLPGYLGCGPPVGRRQGGGGNEGGNHRADQSAPQREHANGQRSGSARGRSNPAGAVGWKQRGAFPSGSVLRQEQSSKQRYQSLCCSKSQAAEGAAATATIEAS